MYRGNYNFFEYKYNIVGYTGQDFGGIAQYLYLGLSVVLLIGLLIVFRKCSKERVLKIIRILSVFLILIYIIKTTWESIYDIKLEGTFNTGLLPLDACSIIMFAGIMAGFSKGKIKEYAEAWIITGGIVGGIANMLFLNALKYYPFFSFGAFYSMLWHFLMVFMGLLLVVTDYVDVNYKNLVKGFVFHVLLSLIVIPIDFIFNFDFMMYHYLGGIPIFESVASEFTKNGMQLLNPLMMLLLYFIGFNIVYVIILIITKIKKKFN